MDFKLNLAKVLSPPGENGWAQVHDFTPDDNLKKEKRGRLIALISTNKLSGTTQEQSIDMVSAGREILSRLHEEYFGNMEQSAFNALKKSVEKVVQEFSKVSKVKIVAVSLVDGVLYSVIGGGGEVGVYRNNMFAPILKTRKEKIVSASGYPVEKDLFLLSTPDLFDKMGPGIVNASLASGNVQEIIESLAPKIHSQKDNGPLGLAVIGFEKDHLLSKVVQNEPENALEDVSLKKPKKILSKFSFKLPKKKLFIRRQEEDIEELQKRKTAFSASLLLLAILATSIGFGINQKVKSDRKDKYEPKLSAAEHNLEEALSLFSLSPDRARELFVESEEIARELANLETEDERITLLNARLVEGRENILGEYVSSEELFLDLAPISDNFRGDILTSSVKNLAVLDRSGKKVVLISIDTKTTEVVSGPAQIKDAKDIAIYEKRVFVLEDDAIYEVGNTKISLIDASWDGDILLNAYANNMYVLDRGSSKIYRYAGTGDAFGSKSSWLAPGIEIDLSKIVAMTVDGSIWILSSSGRVEKYLQGSPQTLETSISPNLVNPVDIYTNEDLLGKAGEYKAQYKNDKLESATFIAVSGETQKIIFLTENKLYSIEIKH